MAIVLINTGSREAVTLEREDMTKQDFSEVVSRYQRLVFTVCYQFTKDYGIAEDLAQETFISAYTHMESCPPDAEKPWLLRIATNKAKDHLKSAYNRHVTATEDEALTVAANAVSFAPPPEDITIAKNEARRIKDKILELKEPYLLVSKMFFIQEKTIEEISKILDRPVKTVHTQLYRAKSILKEEIRKGSG